MYILNINSNTTSGFQTKRGNLLITSAKRTTDSGSSGSTGSNKPNLAGKPALPIAQVSGTNVPVQAQGPRSSVDPREATSNKVLQQIRAVDAKGVPDIDVLPGVPLTKALEVVEGAYHSTVNTVSALNANQQERWIDRDELNVAKARVKRALTLCNNTSQFLSVLDEIVGNRLNYCRQHNLDGKGKRGPQLQDGQVYNTPNGLMIYENGVLRPVGS
jgi:hypothetical protein